MRAVFGLLLIMLGLAMAVVWMPEHHGERQLAVVTDIATQGSSRAARADGVIASGNARTFSPQTPLLATLEAPGPRIAAHTAGVARVASPVSEVGRTTVASTAQATPAAAVVTGGIVTGSLAGANVITSSATAQPPRAGETGTVVRASAAAASMPRDELIRNLQRELKRVGCYHGEIDGDWGTGSRRAMGLFTDRVNATLPIDHPDFILLTLIRGHSSTACGKSCPSDQTMSDTGRCLPNAVVAQVTRRTGDRRRANRETEHDAPSASQNQPTTQSSPQSVAQAETSTTWTTSMRLAGRTSSLETETAAAAAASAATLSGPPLPGRMAMGGGRKAVPS